jgi:hypothetical protein
MSSPPVTIRLGKLERDPAPQKVQIGSQLSPIGSLGIYAKEEYLYDWADASSTVRYPLLTGRNVREQ